MEHKKVTQKITHKKYTRKHTRNRKEEITQKLIEKCFHNIKSKFQRYITARTTSPQKMLDQHKESISATYDIKNANSPPYLRQGLNNVRNKFRPCSKVVQ